MKVAVVGHVEWAAFVGVDHVPVAGEIVEASEGWEQPVGGGAVAAVQIARLAGECLFLTALADDHFEHRAKRDLEAMGLVVEVAWRPATQRRAFVHLDADGERTITVTGDRLQPYEPIPCLVRARRLRCGLLHGRRRRSCPRRTDGTTSRWEAPPLPGPLVDTYGAGDSFAGGLTFALGDGLSVDQAVAFAARCGAACVTGRGPYEGQLFRPVSTR